MTTITELLKVTGVTHVLLYTQTNNKYIALYFVIRYMVML